MPELLFASAGMPILNVIAATNFLIFYMVDKYTFIRLYKTPNKFSTKIGKQVYS